MQKQKLMNVLRFLIPAVVATALWGSATPGAKVAFQWMQIDSGSLAQQMVFAGCRFVPAGVLVLLYAALKHKPLVPLKQDRPKVVLLGFVQIGLFYALYFYGLSHTTSMRCSLLNATAAFFGVGFAHMLRMEKITARKALGCVAGFIGVAVMQAGGGGEGGPFRFAGEGMMLLAAATDGVSSLLGKRATRNVDPIVANGWQLISGGLLLLIPGFLMGGRIPAFPVQGALWLLYLILICAVAFTLWLWLLKNYSVGSVVVFKFLSPVFSTIFTAILLPAENAFAVRNMIALVLICFGLIVVNLHIHHGREQAKA